MEMPNYTKSAIDRYVENGCPIGDFLWGVLTNDLYSAVGHADSNNRLALAEIVMYVHNYLPSCCYGTSDKVKSWITAHRSKEKTLTYGETTLDINAAIKFDEERRKRFDNISFPA